MLSGALGLISTVNTIATAANRLYGLWTSYNPPVNPPSEHEILLGQIADYKTNKPSESDEFSKIFQHFLHRERNHDITSLFNLQNQNLITECVTISMNLFLTKVSENNFSDNEAVGMINQVIEETVEELRNKQLLADDQKEQIKKLIRVVFESTGYVVMIQQGSAAEELLDMEKTEENVRLRGAYNDFLKDYSDNFEKLMNSTTQADKRKYQQQINQAIVQYKDKVTTTSTSNKVTRILLGVALAALLTVAIAASLSFVMTPVGIGLLAGFCILDACLNYKALRLFNSFQPSAEDEQLRLAGAAELRTDVICSA